MTTKLEEWNYGRSTGNQKIFLLIKNSRSMGGGAILTDSIVRITINKREVYRHPNYKKPEFTVKNYDGFELPYSVLVDGEEWANFKTQKQAERWIEFMEGKRNAK